MRAERASTGCSLGYPLWELSHHAVRKPEQPWRSHTEMFWLRYPLTGNINWQTCEWVSLQLLLSCRPEIWRPQSLWTETSHLHCAFSECLTHRILELNKMVVVLPAGFWAYLVGHRSNWNRSPHWEGNVPKGGKGALKYLVEDYSR